MMILFISFVLTGCGDADMQGMILEIRENGVLFSENLSPEEYESIKNKPVSELQNEDVHGERESLSLVELTYDQTDELSEGDQVEVWIHGDILMSYPSQAKAEKISIKKWRFHLSQAEKALKWGKLPLIASIEKLEERFLQVFFVENILEEVHFKKSGAGQNPTVSGLP